MTAGTEVDVDVDVLIVGAGPVGLLGGILASRLGLTTLVIERRDGPQTAPAAHVVNARTYEICRQANLDMPRILAAGKNKADAGHVNFVTRLNGDLIGRLPFERKARPASPSLRHRCATCPSIDSNQYWSTSCDPHRELHCDTATNGSIANLVTMP